MAERAGVEPTCGEPRRASNALPYQLGDLSTAKKWPAAGNGRSGRFPARTPLVRSMPALAVIILLLFALPVAAQDSILPTLEALRGQYPTPLSEAQLGELLNRVAAQHRFEGWGLHKKDGGQRCPQPQGVSISCDLLVHGPTQNVYDVLVDSTGEARPRSAPRSWPSC